MAGIWHCGGERKATAHRLLPETSVGDEWYTVYTMQCPSCERDVMARALSWRLPNGDIATGPQHLIKHKQHEYWLQRIEREVTAPTPAVLGDYTRLISGDTAEVFSKVQRRA